MTGLYSHLVTKRTVVSYGICQAILYDTLKHTPKKGSARVERISNWRISPLPHLPWLQLIHPRKTTFVNTLWIEHWDDVPRRHDETIAEISRSLSLNCPLGHDSDIAPLTIEVVLDILTERSLLRVLGSISSAAQAAP